MAYGIGIDASLELTFDEQKALVADATRLGYESAWTPSGPTTRDGFQVCGQWWPASAAVQPGGIAVGVSVIPAPVWTVASLASQAGTLSDLTGGRFILGLGTGGSYAADFRAMYGLPEVPIVAMMRDYLVTLRALLAGETVTHEGRSVRVGGLRMTGRPLRVPLYISALGPQMLRLAGELADGVCLNWTTPEHRAWCRERIAEGAARAGRDPTDVRLVEYIRVCVDEDEKAARSAFVRAFMGYALGRPGADPTLGYRGHFTRMGFDPELRAIEDQRDRGMSGEALIDLFPRDLIEQMGYFGEPEGAAAAMNRLAQGLDLAIVRIVGVRPGDTAARAVMEACRP